MEPVSEKEKVNISEESLGKAIKKAWLRVIPWILVLYIIAYIDRINISFAIPGMEVTLGITAAIAGLASGIFFIGYFIFQVPGTYMIHKYGARIMITIFLIGWGVFGIINGYVQNAVELYIIRFMIGFFEGAFFPGLIYYISTWFPKKQVAAATALFMTAVPIANIIGSPISGAIVSAFGWRYVFIIEGIPAIIFGILNWFYLTNRPVDAKWLKEDERKALMDKLLDEQKNVEQVQGKYTIGKALKNPKTIALALIYFFWVTNLYAINIWSPTILLLGSKYGLSYIGWILAGVWLIGLVAMVSWAWHSDKTQERIHHTAIPLIIGLVGALLAVVSKENLGLLLFALILIVMGVLMGFGSFWSLPTKFLTAEAAATTIGLVNSIGNLGGFAGPYIIGFIKTATGSFILGYSVIAIFFVLGVILLYVLKFADRRL
jgi:ACS family tartrate transporter-like MFS transporter